MRKMNSMMCIDSYRHKPKPPGKICSCLCLPRISCKMKRLFSCTGDFKVHVHPAILKLNYVVNMPKASKAGGGGGNIYMVSCCSAVLPETYATMEFTAVAKGDLRRITENTLCEQSVVKFDGCIIL